MNLFEVAAVLLPACALASYINYRWIKIPSSIALLLIAMLLGFIGILFKKLDIVSIYSIETLLAHIDFKETVFHGMLAFLLFAGGLQIHIEDLKQSTIPIFITATVSTLISTLIIATLFYLVANQLNLNVPLVYAMLFGAILSPTDPIATLSIIKKMPASKKLVTTIIGESLFNDGVAIVFFLSILELINIGNTHFSTILSYLVISVGGGLLYGFFLGWIALKMLKGVDVFHIELLITLAVATGGYLSAEKMHFSAPLAMVVAGIMIGNMNWKQAEKIESKKYLDAFWEGLDEILNAILFFLLGLEMIVITPSSKIALLGLICIGIALIARFISLAIPLSLIKKHLPLKSGTLRILTWGGLRGALSIAMVLSLENASMKEIFLPCVYFVVIFSITIQGLTFKKLLRSVTRP